MKIWAVLLGALVAAIASKYSNDSDAPPSTSTPDAPRDDSPGVADTVAAAVSDAVAAVVDTVENAAYSVVAVFGTPYDQLINESATRYGLDPALLYRLLYAESHFRPDIITGKKVSSAGALGIAQFMPATAAQELGSVEAALDPAQAIPGAARYLARLIKTTGSVAAGVAAYNWGVGNVQRKGLAKAPAETVSYVQSITGVNIRA